MMHFCFLGKHYNEKCDYTEECSFFDPNSYCSQLPYRSTCECHTGFQYDEIKKVCDKGKCSLFFVYTFITLFFINPMKFHQGIYLSNNYYFMKIVNEF